MKSFIIKLTNCILIAGIVMGYQHYAHAMDNEIKENDKKNALARQEWIKQNSSAKTDKPGLYKDGVYEGKGKGFGGDVVIKITIESDYITDAQIVSAEGETPSYIDAAGALLEDVVTKQTADVDTVSGATLSSNGIIEGLKNALREAAYE